MKRTTGLLLLLAGCVAGKPATYQAELVDCNRTATSCAESIACENRLREREHRPLRDADGGCR